MVREYTASENRLLSNISFNHKDKDRLSIFIEIGLYLTIFLGALLLRLYNLGDRAMHHDESLHAFHSWQLSEGLGLIHNPMMHGPLQMELTAGIFFLFGDSDFTARLLYVLAGSLLTLMPFFFRSWLGRTGGVITSLLFAISPALLYFSRFARNDILMAVFTFGLVIAMWKYIETSKVKYLYFFSGLLALSFGTKESAYLISGLIGLYLIFYCLYEAWNRISEPIDLSKTTYPNLLAKLIKSAFVYFREGISLSKTSPQLSLLVVITCATLPQWSAFLGITENLPPISWINITLLNEKGVIGMPIGGGKVLAFTFVSALLGTSFYIGYRWCWHIWWRCALIFYTIWILIYTTLLTNIGGGIRSGIWQSLGYWIVQQGEARGDQPFHYYLMITPLYEYLPLFVATFAILHYLINPSRFKLFLIYWCITTFTLYTIASEKMPWLLVNITVPLIVLSGHYLGNILTTIRLQNIVSYKNVISIISAPVACIFIWIAIKSFKDANDNVSTSIAITITLSICVVFYIFIKRNLTNQNSERLNYIILGFVAFLTVLTIRTSIHASYKNADIPVEMIVYTQTSPDLKTVAEAFDKMSLSTNIQIDQTNGFTWPWSWYLRNHPNIDYPIYNSGPIEQTITADVILVHSSNNKVSSDRIISSGFKNGVIIPHRWWFPEYTYREVSIKKIAGSISDMDSWHRLLSYWFHRDGVAENIGSEDAYLYTKENFPEIDLRSAEIRSPK